MVYFTLLPNSNNNNNNNNINIEMKKDYTNVIFVIKYNITQQYIQLKPTIMNQSDDLTKHLLTYNWLMM